jgi:hypothetical protein
LKMEPCGRTGRRFPKKSGAWEALRGSPAHLK